MTRVRSLEVRGKVGTESSDFSSDLYMCTMTQVHPHLHRHIIYEHTHTQTIYEGNYIKLYKNTPRKEAWWEELVIPAMRSGVKA